MEDINKYNIHWKVLNTKDYGIPQCRERLYIIGINKNKSKHNFSFPKEIKMKNLTDFIDTENVTKKEIKESNKELFKNIANSMTVDVIEKLLLAGLVSLNKLWYDTCLIINWNKLNNIRYKHQWHT